MSSTVVVVPYDPAWVQLFEQLRDFVFPAVSDLALSIEHVGSTSIPGLAAKPIVDMDIVVSAQADAHAAIHRLAGLGYVHEGDLGITGREAFIPPGNMPRHHLYVCTRDNSEYRRHILFRDYLRSHPEEAEQYGKLKLELAHKFTHDRVAYTNGKSKFVNDVLKRAGWS